MSLDLRLMRYVITVAEAGSFQAAAHRLRMAESPLSRQIKALERELGVDLFRRRPTQLTESGRVFVESARRVLDEAERTITRTRLAASHGDLVRVGHTPSTSYHLIPQLLAWLRFQHPDIRVDRHEHGGAEIDAGLHAGSIDVGIGHGLMHPPGFAVEVLRRDRFGVVVGRRHQAAHRGRVALRDLRGETLHIIRREVAPRWYDQVLGAVLRTGETFDLADDHGPGGALTGVGEREGFAVFPEGVVEWLPEGYAWVAVTDDMGTTDLEVVWRTATSPAAVKVVVNAAHEVAGSVHVRHEPWGRDEDILDQSIDL